MPGYRQFDRTDPRIWVGTREGVRRHRNWKRGRAGLIAPLDLDPASVRWPVHDLEVVVVYVNDDQAQFAARLAGCLVRDGAGVVLVLGTDSGRILSRHVKLDTA